MINDYIIENLYNASKDLDDMDFTQIFGDEEGLLAFRVFDEDFSRDIVAFIHSLNADLRARMLSHINTQFFTDASKMPNPLQWRPASEAPYDEPCIFKTVQGHVVEGFIYDGDEKDFGYTHFIPIPVD